MPELLLVRNPALLLEGLGDKVLLVDIHGNQVIEFNKTGALLWRRLDEPVTQNELVGILAESYPDAPLDGIADDVAAFLETALNCGAVLKQKS